MMTQTIPNPEEVLALLKKTEVLPTDKDSFIKAFKALYPALTDEDRMKLLKSVLEYADSLLKIPATKVV